MTNKATEQFPGPPIGGSTRKRGRPPEADPTESHTINLRASRWKFLEPWAAEGSSKSKQLEFLLERLENVFPEGPGRIGHAPDPDAPKKARLSAAVSRAARARGMDKATYINECSAFYEAQQAAKRNATAPASTALRNEEAAE